jgi:hypothetical protein
MKTQCAQPPREKSPEKSPENSRDVVEMLLPGPTEALRATSVSERQCGASWNPGEFGIHCAGVSVAKARVLTASRG